MANLKRVKFGHGDVVRLAGVEPTPTTVHESGSVTVKNVGSPGHPAHYEVSFMLVRDCEESALEFSNIFHWKIVVPEPNAYAPYLEIESAAARQIGPMLRAVAQKIEEQVAEFDTNNPSPASNGS